MARNRMRIAPRHRHLAGWLCCLLAALPCPSAWSQSRPVRANVQNYEETPVRLMQASVQLTETYANPMQFPIVIDTNRDVKFRRSQVRYMNRLNQQIATYMLEGELRLHNDSAKAVEALQLTTIFLNAFQERVKTERDAVTETLRPHTITKVAWSKGAPHEEVFEMVFVITAVRFADGTVWTPTEELIQLP